MDDRQTYASTTSFALPLCWLFCNEWALADRLRRNHLANGCNVRMHVVMIHILSAFEAPDRQRLYAVGK